MPTFWDLRAELTPKGDETKQPDTATGDVWSVSDYARQIKMLLKNRLPNPVRVRGEISRWTRAGSGHRYFTLKDNDSAVDAKMWGTAARSLDFEPAEGDEVVVEGYADFWNKRGQLSLVCESIGRAGEGALEAAFQKLKSKLGSEGLFDPERKLPIPPYPRRIAIVTSPDAAGYQDVLKVLSSQPHLKLMLMPVPVQGDAAAGTIGRALNLLSERHADVGGVDVALLIRGGGSREDLWAFNEEEVARAVAACRVPIIAGIGHETDEHIADLAADHHAHTPTQAAQVVIRHWRVAGDRVGQLGVVLRRAVRQLTADASAGLKSVRRHEMFRRPTDVTDRGGQALDEATADLRAALARRLDLLDRRLRDARSRLLVRDPRHQLQLQRQRVASLAQRLSRSSGVMVTGRKLPLGSSITDLRSASRLTLDASRGRTSDLARRINAASPERRLQAGRRAVEQAQLRLRFLVGHRLQRATSAATSATRQLRALDPTAVLARGYSITLDANGHVVRTADDVSTGDVLQTRTSDGDVHSVVQ